MKLVILDRDGVINEDSEDYVKSPAQWVPLPGSLEAIARLNQAQYRVVVATNQSGVAQGLLDVDTLHTIHLKMNGMLTRIGGRIEAVFFCPHGPDDGCACRKPKPGLFLEITRRLRTNLRGVPAVGDSLRDISAARTAGAQPVLVLTGKGMNTLASDELTDDVAVYDDLASFSELLLST